MRQLALPLRSPGPSENLQAIVFFELAQKPNDPFRRGLFASVTRLERNRPGQNLSQSHSHAWSMHPAMMNSEE